MFYKLNVGNSPEFLCDLIPHSVGETNNYNLPNCSFSSLSELTCPTGTCFIQKIYAPSSSLLQGKHLPFPLSHFASIFFAYL
jgi:hypothetical protein